MCFEDQGIYLDRETEWKIVKLLVLRGGDYTLSKKKKLNIEYVSEHIYSEEEVENAKRQLCVLISSILNDDLKHGTSK